MAEREKQLLPSRAGKEKKRNTTLDFHRSLVDSEIGRDGQPLFRTAKARDNLFGQFKITDFTGRLADWLTDELGRRQLPVSLFIGRWTRPVNPPTSCKVRLLVRPWELLASRMCRLLVRLFVLAIRPVPLGGPASATGGHRAPMTRGIAATRGGKEKICPPRGCRSGSV